MNKKRSRSIILYVLSAIAVLAILALIVALLFPVFARSRAKARVAYGPPPPGMAELAWEPEGGEYDAAKPAEGGSLFGTAAEAAIAQQIVYKADYRIEVDDATAAGRQVEAVAKEFGGFLSDRSTSIDDEGNRSVRVTIRVPSAKFPEALARIEKLGKVIWGNVEREDVTRQYIDLQARLRNAEREEERLAELMKRTAKLSDIVTVEEKLSSVQERIERLKGELSYLNERVALSTISVSLFEKGPGVVSAPGPFHIYYHLQNARNALIAVLRAIVYVIIYGIIVGWVVWLPLVIWHIARRRRRPSPPEG